MQTQQALAKLLRSNITFQHVSIHNYSINYIKAGSGEPLLLIHGANIGWPQWYKNIDELAKHFTVFAIDLPGAGDSTKIDFHKVDIFKEFVDIVDAFVMTEISDKKIAIIGASIGGWIALKLAIDNKPYINKVILSNPLGLTTYMPLKFRPVAVKQWAKLISKTALKPDRNNKNLEKFMRGVFYDKDLVLEPEFIDYFYELSQTSHNLMFISRLAHPLGMRKELYLANDLRKIRAPVMLIWGKQDPLMPYSKVRQNFKLIPHAKIEVLPQTGHMPPIEDNKKFNELAISFLNERK